MQLVRSPERFSRGELLTATALGVLAIITGTLALGTTGWFALRLAKTIPPTPTDIPTSPTTLTSASQCNDTVDNDGDGLIDFHPVVARHQAAADPTSEGWYDSPFGFFGATVTVGPVYGDRGLDAWKVEDTTGLAQRWYGHQLSPAQVAQMTQGWTYRGLIRVVSTLENPRIYGAVEMRASMADRTYKMHLGKNRSGDPLVHLRTHYDNPIDGVELTLTGLGDGYHLYELKYLPAQNGVDFYVDGVLRQQNWKGIPTSAIGWNPGDFEWGSNATAGGGIGNYSLMEIELTGGDPGCTSPEDNDESGGAAQCSDSLDNADLEDALIDAADPGCHSDRNQNNPGSYQSSDNDETDSISDSPTPSPSGSVTPLASGSPTPSPSFDPGGVREID